MLNSMRNEICVIGLGYVGLTLSAAFLSKGERVIGVEHSKEILECLERGQIPFFEPSLEPVIQRSKDRFFKFSHDLPERVQTAFICVGTPYDLEKQTPRLDDLLQAVQMLLPHLDSDSLVIVRSTVPVGTTRELIEPLIRKGKPGPLLVFAPERTIQGNALHELLSLPQIIGTPDNESFLKAEALFRLLNVECVRLQTYEAAELAKLICNAHTDMVYGFGNEVASIAEGFGLDAREVIRAANWNYPRPSIHLPGYVGGSCLTKDPYHLIYSSQSRGYRPSMVEAARALNENLPERMMRRIDTFLHACESPWTDRKVMLSGAAYKGSPATDDMRGSLVWKLLSLLSDRQAGQVGVHDFVVNESILTRKGFRVLTWEEGLRDSDTVLLLNNYPIVQSAELVGILRSKEDCLIYDVWGVLQEAIEEAGNAKIRYMGVGFCG